MTDQLDDARIVDVRCLLSPQLMKRAFDISKHARQFIANGRQQIADILHGRDDRLLCIVGPCSIHDPVAAIEYAKHLIDIRNDRLLIVMRTYFEKPRTALGWKGFIADPRVNGEEDFATGLVEARRLLMDLAELGILAATEFVDPIVPQYIGDLIAWAAVGARTMESPTHRHMGSGLSMPVGFKNRLDGDIRSAVNAVVVAQKPHTFLGIDQDGNVSSLRTTGNSDAHLVLRGGTSGPNYDEVHTVKEQVPDIGIVVDCSHGNSAKDPERQVDVWNAVVKHVNGIMLESFLRPGRQDVPKVFGQSITDACLGWPQTKELLESYG